MSDTELQTNAIRLMETCGLLLVTGSDDIQRSAIGRYLQTHYSKQGYTPLTVHTPSEWQVVPQGGKKHVALLDDVLGGDSLDEENYEEWCDILSSFPKVSVQLKCLVVMSVSSSVVEVIRSRGNSDSDLFQHMEELDTDQQGEDVADKETEIGHDSTPGKQNKRRFCCLVLLSVA